MVSSRFLQLAKSRELGYLVFLRSSLLQARAIDASVKLLVGFLHCVLNKI